MILKVSTVINSCSKTLLYFPSTLKLRNYQFLALNLTHVAWQACNTCTITLVTLSSFHPFKRGLRHIFNSRNSERFSSWPDNRETTTTQKLLLDLRFCHYIWDGDLSLSVRIGELLTSVIVNGGLQQCTVFAVYQHFVVAYHVHLLMFNYSVLVLLKTFQVYIRVSKNPLKAQCNWQ